MYTQSRESERDQYGNTCSYVHKVQRGPANASKLGCRLGALDQGHGNRRHPLEDASSL